jgi:sulfite reductase (ferredoxin)
MYPLYLMSLGGRADGEAMLGVNCMRVPAKRIIQVILKIIEIFKKNKKPEDTLSSWLNRIVKGNENSQIKSVNDLKQILSPLVVPPTKDEDADFYADFGSDTKYHTITGKGECAA